jgi:hypothetical protein
MNFIDPTSHKEARLRYGDGEYTVMKTGDYVRCGVTGAIIPLDELRHWNIDKQIAYKSADVAFADMAQR